MQTFSIEHDGTAYQLFLKVITYPDGNLAIKLYCGDSDYLDFWGNLTINLSGIRPQDCSFINVLEYGTDILIWIAANNLAEPTGQIRQIDGVEFPEYCFFPEKLLASDKDGYTYYSRCQKGELGR